MSFPAHCPTCRQPLSEAVEECPHCHAPLMLQAQQAPAPVTVDTLWRQARDTFARYDYAAAVAAAQAVLQAAPGHEEAARLKAQAEEKLQTLQVALKLANEYFNKGQYELAVVHFNTVLGLCPTDEANRRKLEMAKLLAGQDLTAYTPKPIRHATSKWADEVVPSPVSTMAMTVVVACGVLYLCFYFYQRTQRYHRTAEDLYQAVERKLVTQEYFTGDAEASYKQLTTVYGDTKFAKDAAELYATTKARQLEQAYLRLDQAEAYLVADRPTLAIEIAREVLRWDPQNSRAQELIAQAEDAAGRLEQQYMHAAMHGKPLPASSSTGEAFADTSWMSARDEEFAPAVAKLVRQGQSRFARGDYTGAATLWEQAAQQHGRPHRVLDALITRAHELDRRALERLEEYQARAESLEANGRTTEALAAYREAQLYQPENPRIQERINALSAQLHQKPPETLTPAPNVPSDHWRAEADTYETAGQWRRAIQVYRRWFAAAPAAAVRQQIELNYMIDAGQGPRASRAATEVWRQIVLAEAYLVKGHLDDARRIVTETLAHVPNKATGQRAFLLALQAETLTVSSPAEAITVYRQSLDTARVWYVQHQLATLLWEGGKYLEAIRLWEDACKRWPDQVEIMAALATSYVLMDQVNRANVLMEPLKRWKMAQLQKTQRYPMTVRPDYWLGMTSEDALLSELCDHVAQVWVLLDQPLESLRWRQWVQLQHDAQQLAERRLSEHQSWWPWR